MKRPPSPPFRGIDIPVPSAESPEDALASRLGSTRASEAAIEEVAAEVGLKDSPRAVLAALALAKLGIDIDRAARSLDWKDFEEFCASTIAGAGYDVSRDVRLKKPTRQIDIVAESSGLVLAVDCKHWRRGAGERSLEVVALAQRERARLLRRSRRGKEILPVIITMVDSRVKVVRGVAVVPVAALRDFLSSVSRFDADYSFFKG